MGSHDEDKEETKAEPTTSPPDVETCISDPLWGSSRLALAFIGFLGAITIYLMRINMSVALVCMTIDDSKNKTSPNDSAAFNPSSWNSDAYLRSSSDFNGHRGPQSATMGSESMETFARRWMGLTPYDEDERCDGDDDDDDEETGEFDWDRQLRGNISSSFFVGYTLTQILGGWLATRYGGKLVVGLGMTLACVTTMLSPPAASVSPYFLMVMRFINGLGQGVYFPAFYDLLGRWAPPTERSRLSVLMMSGVSLGNVFSFGLSGVLCADLGWQWIFWVYGLVAAVWIVAWILLVHDNPSDHPRISQQELDYIRVSNGKKLNATAQKSPPVPWVAMLTSPAIICMIVADFCNSWGGSAGLTQLPQYMEDVLQVDIKKNGLYNSLPHLLKWFTSLGFAVIADFMIVKGVSAIATRKIMNTFGGLLPAVFVLCVGYLDCNTAGLAIMFITLQEGFTGAIRSGSQVNRIDIAPRFAGVVMGICNTAGQLAGVFAPIAIGAITTDGTRDQWQKSFTMSACFYVLGWLSFTIFGRGGPAKWAILEDDIEEIVVKCPPTEESMRTDEKSLPSEESYELQVIQDEYNTYM